MPVIGITGGVASGKSTVTQLLSRRLAAEVFDADAAARDLVESDSAIKQRISSQFGLQFLRADGQIDRVLLREAVFGSLERRRSLEAILHPVLREQWKSLADAARRDGAWLLVDIPLLFETGAEVDCDTVVVIACAPATQRARIVAQRGLSTEMAERIIASQASLAFKAARAHCVIWNEASLARLEEQAELFAGYLGKRYG